LLHELVIDGDQSALQQLFQSAPRVLRWRLRHAYPKVADSLIDDGIEEALVEYALRPAGFDSSRGVPLDRVLYHRAWRNVANLLMSDQKRRTREMYYAQAAIVAMSSGKPVRAAQGQTTLLLGLVADDSERDALRLWLEGERRTTPLASILGVAALSLSEQRRTVKRFKDRIRNRVKRLTSGRTPGSAI
jgi:hypothetical protein